MPEKKVEHLRREISFFGAFSMGFADVGADVFLAIGIVTLYAGGFAPISFLIASVCYITTGLVYAELTSLYPYAGGGQVFGMRAGGATLGFLVGWAILLDYILDIGLFSIASAGYLSYLLPSLNNYIYIGVGSNNVAIPLIGFAALIIVIFLIGINLIGIKESSRFNESLVVTTLVIEFIILILAFTTAFSLGLFLSDFKVFGNPVPQSHVFYSRLFDTNVENFIYGVTLAMSSFIGIESIAQAAEETRNPWKHLPSSFKYSIIAVIFFTLSFSVLGIGVLGWRGLADSIYNPVAQIASRVPLIGHHFALIVAFVAFLITLVSTNTGVIGVSRVTYSMAKFNLIPRVFSRLHRKRAVPYISIVFFGIIGGALALTGNLEMVAGLYNFGALLSYMLVNYSHIKLRVVDADAYRPWKTPLNVRIGDYEISLLALIGLVSTASLFFLVVVYHPMGRFLGGIWVVVGLVSFIVYHKIYLRRKVVEEIKLKPIIYKIRTAVIVPLYVDSDTLYKSIYYNFEDIHDLRLISLVEFPRVFRRPLTVSWREVLSIKHDIERRLDEVCSRLREKGFMCSKFVVVGTKESLVHHIVNINPDTIVILTNRKPRRKGLEHPLAKSLKGDYRIVYLFKA